MNEKRSWKKTEEAEIDLTDLLQKLGKRWKQIVVCALVFTVLAGAAGVVRTRNTQTGEADPAVKEETELTEEEQQAVTEALRLAKETKGLETYMERSVLMQADPFEKSRVVSLYSVEHASGRDMIKITECYLNYLNNGGAAQALQKTGGKNAGLSGRYLSEVITAWQKTDNTYKMMTDAKSGNGPETAVFYVETVGKDKTMAQQMAEGIREALKDYQTDAVRTCGKHTLTRLSCITGTVTDNGLFTQQHERMELLKTYRTSLKAAEDALNTDQKEVYLKTAGRQKDPEENGQPQMTGGGFSVRYLIFGCIAGIFIYCAVFVIRYLLLDTIKSEAEFCACYRMPCYGMLAGPAAGSSTPSARARRENEDAREQERIVNRIRLACQKRGIQKICLAADFVPAQQERLCLEHLAQRLQEWEIAALPLDDAGRNAAVWDTAAETGTVLLVCKTGCSTHRMVEREMEFYLENGITVLGAALLEGN